MSFFLSDYIPFRDMFCFRELCGACGHEFFFVCEQACVVKREFRKAEQLIKHAVFLAR